MITRSPQQTGSLVVTILSSLGYIAGVSSSSNDSAIPLQGLLRAATLNSRDNQTTQHTLLTSSLLSPESCAIGIHTVQRNDYSDDIAAKSVISETGTRIIYDCLRSSRATVARPNPVTGSTTTGQALACGGWALAGETLNLNVTLFYSSSLRNVQEVNNVLVQSQCMYRRLVENPVAPPCNTDVGDGGDSGTETESMDSMEQSMSIEESELQAAGALVAISGGTEPTQQGAKVVEQPMYCRPKDVRSGNEGCVEGEKCLSMKGDWLTLVLGVVANRFVEWGNCVLIQGESSI